MPYAGKNMGKRYISDAVDITYNLRRCIHAEQCIHHLESVFKKNTRPWIDINGASTTEIMGVIALCPSGALHAIPKDGTASEEPSRENVISLWEDGPLQFEGKLEIIGANIDITDETRATLCRCGESKNKPFCDNSHREVNFEAPDIDDNVIVATTTNSGIVSIIPESNGPYHVTGHIEIVNQSGEIIWVGDETWLCRCGHSSHKPFCDDTHATIGFQAE